MYAELSLDYKLAKEIIEKSYKALSEEGTGCLEHKKEQRPLTGLAE